MNQISIILFMTRKSTLKDALAGRVSLVDGKEIPSLGDFCPVFFFRQALFGS